MKSKPCVLTIAGSDASGGAGIQADIKAISATGAYAASVITLITAQNTVALTAVHALPIDWIAEQMDAVFSDLNIVAVKIGMLYHAETVDIVFSKLIQWNANNIVVDPVMYAQSGCSLMKENTLNRLKSRLSIVNLITPNVPEAEIWLNAPILKLDDMKVAAERIADIHQVPVLIKGGRLDHHKAIDVFYDIDARKCHLYSSERIVTNNLHGTGCTLSSAIASYLAQGVTLPQAITRAKTYIIRAIQSASHWAIGKGQGPVDHLFNIRDES